MSGSRSADSRSVLKQDATQSAGTANPESSVSEWQSLPDYGLRIIVWSWASAVFDVLWHMKRGDLAWAKRSHEQALLCFALSLEAAGNQVTATNVIVGRGDSGSC